MRSVTLKDIAAAAGVSKSTAARALSAHPSVRPETRRHVRDIAAKLGYEPDPALRALASYRWRRPGQKRTSPTLAFIRQSVDRMIDGRLQQMPVGWEHIDGAREQARTLGYRLDEFDLRSMPSVHRLADMLRARGIQGLLIGPMIEGDPLAKFPWADFTAVGCSVGEFRPPLHCVDTSYFASVRLAWRHCRARGYRRIGAALFHRNGPDHNIAARQAAALYEKSLQPPNQARLPSFNGALDDRDGFLRWHDREHPDVVIALNERPYWWLHETGIRMPADLGFCAINHRSESEVTGVLRNHRRIGARAVAWLDQMLRAFQSGPPSEPEEIQVPPAWFEGTTLRAPFQPVAELGD